MQKFVGIFGLFFVCLGMGYGLMYYTTDPYQVNRDPAAVRNSFDFSNLSGEKLHEAAKQRLLAGFEMEKGPEGASFSLGHFAFINAKGEKTLACQEFGKVNFVFEAEGVSVAGDRPSMEIEGHCGFTKDMAKIDPLLLPIAKILGEKPGDGEFQFNENAITVRFTNVPEEWPRLWLLKTVKLKSEDNTQVLTVESNDVARILGHPLVLNF